MKKTKFTLTVTWIILSRSFDAYCTMQFTPDLKKESNPLVSIMGMSWIPLMTVLILLSLYIIYTFYISYFNPMNLFPKEKGYRLRDFMTYMYLGRKDHWSSILFKFPNSIKRFNHYMGQTLPQCISFAGIISTIMWLLIKYSNYYKTIHSPILIYSILILGSLSIAFNWNRKMYKRYLSENLD